MPGLVWLLEEKLLSKDFFIIHELVCQGQCDNVACIDLTRVVHYKASCLALPKLVSWEKE